MRIRSLHRCKSPKKGNLITVHYECSKPLPCHACYVQVFEQAVLNSAIGTYYVSHA